MAIEQKKAGVDRNKSIELETKTPDLELFPEKELAITHMRRAGNLAAIAAHIDIQRLTGGKPEKRELSREEKNNRTITIDTDAQEAFQFALREAPYESYGIISEGAKEEKEEKLGLAMPLAKGKHGAGEMKVDFGNDAVECTGWAIVGKPDAFAATGFTTHNGIMEIPSIESTGEEANYFRKFFTHGFFKKVVSLERSAKQNFLDMAKLAGIDTSAITIALLERDCNEKIIQQARELNVSIEPLARGDLIWCLRAMQADPQNPIVMLGRGGAPEGGIAMIAARALEATGQVRVIENEDNVVMIDKSPIWTPEQFVPGAKEHSMFILSAITQNTHYGLDPVQHIDGNRYLVHDVLVDSSGFHTLPRKPVEFPLTLAS